MYLAGMTENLFSGGEEGDGISTVPADVRTTFETIKRHLMFFFFQTCLQRHHFKKINLKNSKVVKAKKGPRLHHLKKNRGEQAPGPP